jgi:phosphoribosylanthranilate isomerase
VSSALLVPGRGFSGLIQVAGVHDLAEARDMADAGVHALGLPLRLPVHTPDLSEPEAEALVAALPPALVPVLITYETRPRSLVGLARRLGVRHVQLHAALGKEGAATLARIKDLAPDFFLIKSLVVRGAAEQAALEAEMEACAPHVDAFITDTFDPASGATGATGQIHDWELSRRLVMLSPRPVILAGGLHPGNVAAAIAQVRPAGVDAHTGLEDVWGRKNPELLRAFAARAKEAFILIDED